MDDEELQELIGTTVEVLDEHYNRSGHNITVTQVQNVGDIVVVLGDDGKMYDLDHLNYYYRIHPALLLFKAVTEETDIDIEYDCKAWGKAFKRFMDDMMKYEYIISKKE